jgi:hypothetical protein
MMKDWDYREVQDFDCLDKIWDNHKIDDESTAAYYMDELNRYLGLGLAEVNAAQSKFFKEYISRGWRNRDIMVKEIDVIRQEENW